MEKSVFTSHDRISKEKEEKLYVHIEAGKVVIYLGVNFFINIFNIHCILDTWLEGEKKEQKSSGFAFNFIPTENICSFQATFPNVPAPCCLPNSLSLPPTQCAGSFHYPCLPHKHALTTPAYSVLILF